MSLGASTGTARMAAGAYAGVGYGRPTSPGVGPTPGPAITPFPGLVASWGTPDFLIWAVFFGALVYMLGMHWLLGSARRVVAG